MNVSSPWALMTDLEAAQMLGVSMRHLRRMLSRGEFPEPIRLGRCTRWSRKQIEDWIAQGCPPTKKQADK
jgi:excisionase family DNA binding protein